MSAILSNRCYMTGCKNNRILREKKTSMRMFLFPSNKNIAKVWLAICKCQPYECPYHGQAVCKDHFRSEHIINNASGRISLKPNAIPTANIPNICYSLVAEYYKKIFDNEDVDSDVLSVNVEYDCERLTCLDPERAITIHKVRKNLRSNTISEPNQPVREKRTTDSTASCEPPIKIIKVSSNTPVASPSSITEETSNDSTCIPSQSEYAKETTLKTQIGHCKVVERKTIVLPTDVQAKISVVIKCITDIVQNFMAFQIYIIHLEQKIVTYNEKLSDNVQKWNVGEVHEMDYLKYSLLHVFILKLHEVHNILSTRLISFCNKIWNRAIDCHKELKTQGQLRTFITNANGCLVTVVKVIDAMVNLKSIWLSIHQDEISWKKADSKAVVELKNDAEWQTFNEEVKELLNDATEKLEVIDDAIHAIRQRIMEVKNPAIRIMEVTQMSVSPELIYIAEALTLPKTGENRNTNQDVVKKIESFSELKEILQQPPKKPSVKITLKSITHVSPTTSTSSLTTPSSSTFTTTQSITTPSQSNNITMNPTPATIQTIPQTYATSMMNTTQPTLTATMPQLMPMQAQLIPTIQLDAFGNQTIVYQIAYQSITPVDQSMTNLMPQLMQPTLAMQPNTTILTQPQPEQHIVQNIVPINNMETLSVIKQEKIDEEQENPHMVHVNMDGAEVTVKQEPEWNEDD